MINTDEDALVCDLAETYHIFDMRELPPLKVAVFSCGLRESSRIKMIMSDYKVNTTQLLLATCADYLALLVWFQTENGRKNINRPTPLVNLFLKNDNDKKSDIVGFDSPEEFEAYRQSVLERIKQCQQ